MNGIDSDIVSTTLTISDGLISDPNSRSFVINSTDNDTATFLLSSASLQSLSEGTLVVDVEATDSAGNKASINRNFIYDRTVDMPQITGPISTDNVINASDASSVFIQGTADAGNTISIELVDVRKNIVVPRDSQTGSPLLIVVQSDGTFSANIDVRSLQEGPLQLRVNQSDPVGNISIPYTRTLGFDRTSPELNVNNITVTGG